MKIYRLVSDLLASNMYIIEENNHAILIDPYIQKGSMKNLIIDKIILTHEHYDHISGVNYYKEKYNVPVLCSNACAKNIENPRKNLSRYFDALYEIQDWIDTGIQPVIDYNYRCHADETFCDELVMEWQNHQLNLKEIPGHSEGSIGIFVDDKDFFSGDSLILGHEVNLRFPGANKYLWETVGKQQIESVDAGTHIWPGHFEDFIFSTCKNKEEDSAL